MFLKQFMFSTCSEIKKKYIIVREFNNSTPAADGADEINSWAVTNPQLSKEAAGISQGSLQEHTDLVEGRAESWQHG